MKSGYIAIVGKANAGKSTLLNSLVGQKISIVSPKPQTTRDNITGIYTESDCQMIFVDTPGALRPSNRLGDYMVKNIEAATVDVDCVLLVLDGHDGIDESELALAEKYSALDAPLVVAVTKTDITQPEKLFPELEKLKSFPKIREVFAVSAKKNRGVAELRNGLKKYLGDEIMYFAEDEVTDRPLRFLVCETLREKILLCCESEVPHGVGIVLNKMEFDEQKRVWFIDQNIIVEKQSHKPIILGKNGAMLKSIATHARASMEKLLGDRVFLELWIKVKPNWRDNPYMLNEIGYDKSSV